MGNIFINIYQNADENIINTQIMVLENEINRQQEILDSVIASNQTVRTRIDGTIIPKQDFIDQTTAMIASWQAQLDILRLKL